MHPSSLRRSSPLTQDPERPATRLYYFEHYIAEAGLYRVARAAVLRTVADERVYQDITAELVDLFPDATIEVLAPEAVFPGTDLVVLPVQAPYEFPFHDVLYERLHALEPLERAVARAAFVMVYRATWREVEVVPARRWRARLRKRRVEAGLIRLCRRSTLLRRLLRPEYPS